MFVRWLGGCKFVAPIVETPKDTQRCGSMSFFLYINFKLYLAEEEESFEAKMIQGQRGTSFLPPRHDLGRQSQTWVNLLSKNDNLGKLFLLPHILLI